MAHMKCSQIILIIFIIASLLLMIAVFATTGIFVVDIPKIKDVRFFKQSELIELQRDILDGSGVKPDALQPSNDIVLHIPKMLTLSAGLWYFRTCINETNYFSSYGIIHEDGYCNAVSYPEAKDALLRLPSQMQGINIDEIYNNIGEIAKFAAIEIQVEMTAAVVCLIITLVTTVCYFVGNSSKRGVGLTAYITALIAGVLNMVATSKCITLILQAKVLLHSNFDFDMSEVQFLFPYGLFLSGLSGIFILGCSLALLLTLTDRKLAFQKVYSETLGDGPISAPVNATVPHVFTSNQYLINNEVYNENGK